VYTINNQRHIFTGGTYKKKKPKFKGLGLAIFHILYGAVWDFECHNRCENCSIVWRPIGILVIFTFRNTV
jgi:hypothetical protein